MTTTPSKRDDDMGPERFILRWDRKRGGYYVSEPEIDTCEVVRADLYDSLAEHCNNLQRKVWNLEQALSRLRTKEITYSFDGRTKAEQIVADAIRPPTNPIAPGSEVDGGGG